MDSLKSRIFKSPGYQIGSNGSCWLYNGFASPGGYIIIGFRHPETKKLTSSSVHRLSFVLSQGQDMFEMPPRDLDASHLCHNKTCIRPEHISLEPKSTNSQRKNCVSQGKCLGHDPYPKCFLELKL